MKRSLLLALAVCLLPGLSCAGDGAAVYYVAPGGRDDAAGSTGSPFATLPHALRVAREAGKPATIRLRGGVYRLAEPVEIGPGDSGVTIAACENETPVLSGGRRIKGWRITNVGGKVVWAVDLPEVREGKWEFRELWVNGRRALRARHPHRGYLSVEKGVDTVAKPGMNAGQTEFLFKKGDLPPSASATGADLVVLDRWVDSHLPVLRVDEARSALACGRRSVFRVDPGALAYLEGLPSFLTEAGDWALDRAAGTLYYLPMPGETPEQAEAIAPRLGACVLLKGDPVKGRCVEKVVFRGLTFSHSEWYFPANGKAGWPSDAPGGFPQASVKLPAAV